jgi:hypothetical protein
MPTIARATQKRLLGTSTAALRAGSLLERYFKIYRYTEFRQRRAAIVAKTNESKIIRTLIYSLILTWNLFWTLFKDNRLRTVGAVYWRYFGSIGGYIKKGLPAMCNLSIAAWHTGIFGNLPKRGPTASCVCSTRVNNVSLGVHRYACTVGRERIGATASILMGASRCWTKVQ